MTACRVLITGGAGFIGFHMSKRLMSRPGFKVTLLDNLNDYYDINLKLNRLKYLKDNFTHNFSFEKLDITNKDSVDRIFESGRFDVVINLAAQAGVRYAKENPGVYISSNIDGFFNVIDAARRNNIKLMVYASSSSVYGGNDSLPFRESEKCTNPLSIYAASKLSNEMIAEAYKNSFGLRCIGLRFFNVYGPWGRPDAVYYKWSQALFFKGIVELRDGGEMYRDMTYVDDVTRCLEALIDRGLSKMTPEGRLHEIFNIGNESPVRMGDLLEYLKDKFKNEPAAVISSPRGAEEPITTRASTEKLKKAIGYVPSTPYQKGVDDFVQWYISYYG